MKGKRREVERGSQTRRGTANTVQCNSGLNGVKKFTARYTLQVLNYADLIARLRPHPLFKSLRKWVRGVVYHVPVSPVDRRNAWRVLRFFGLVPRAFWSLDFRGRLRLLCQKLLRILLTLVKTFRLHRFWRVEQVFERPPRADSLGAAFFTSAVMSRFGFSWNVVVDADLPPKKLARAYEKAFARACLIAERLGYEVRCYRCNAYWCCLILGDNRFRMIPSPSCPYSTSCPSLFFYASHLPLKPGGGDAEWPSGFPPPSTP